MGKQSAPAHVGAAYGSVQPLARGTRLPSWTCAHRIVLPSKNTLGLHRGSVALATCWQEPSCALGQAALRACWPSVFICITPAACMLSADIFGHGYLVLSMGKATLATAILCKRSVKLRKEGCELLAVRTCSCYTLHVQL